MGIYRLTKRDIIFILIVTFIMATMTASIYIWVLPIKYQSSVTLFAMGANVEENKVSLYESIETGIKLKNDYVNIVKSSEIIEEVKNTVAATMPDINNYTVEYINKNIEIDSIENSRVFKVNYTDTNPERAILFVNTIGDILKAKVKSYIKIDSLQIISSAKESTNKTISDLPRKISLAALFGCFLSICLILLGKYIKVFFSESRNKSKDKTFKFEI